MSYILFVLYLVVFTWLVTRIKFFRRSELSSTQISILFVAKVVAGIFYGWIGLNYGDTAAASDTWWLHWEGVKEYHLLLKDPKEFFASLFHSPYAGGYGNFFSVTDSWWNDVKSNAFLKFLALLNLLSFGNYYVNLILYSFITMFGTVGFYRVMKDIFPMQRIAVLLGTFLLPSFIYWCGGIHKDGIIFLAIATIVYHLYFGMRSPRHQAYRYVIGTICLLAILLLRNFMLLTLIPALAAWYLSHKLKYKPLLVFAGLYLLFGLVFFTAKYLHPSLDFPAATMARQESFIELTGNSDISVQKLEPDFTSFVRIFPQAFYLSALRPTFSDVKHLLSLAACVELYLYLLLFMVFLGLRIKDSHPDQRFILFCVFFGVSVLLMIGYSVNNLGAIVRYRSIALPFLIVPMLTRIDWKRIGKVALNT